MILLREETRVSGIICNSKAAYLLDSKKSWTPEASSLIILSMNTNHIKVQGRQLSPNDISYIRELIHNNPSWSRRRISEELSKEWNWRNAAGQLKDMACRSMLLKLEKQGYIIQPPRRCIPVNRMMAKKIKSVPHDQSLIEGKLKEIQPIKLLSLRKEKEYEELFSHLLQEYHYKGYKGVVGENMKYVVLDRHNRILSCLLFGSSAWKVESRDKFIGWDIVTREAHLHLITNNMRYLILPWVKIPHLASHILSKVTKQISRDWITSYGHPIYALETFVECDKYKGTCYKASNWICVGRSKGRSRNDRYRKIKTSQKDVYIYPLKKKILKEPSHK